jgi:hypothetical protein
MLVYILYVLLILALIYWVEQPGLFFSKSLIIKKTAGESLEEWLKKFHWGSRQHLHLPGMMPQYKFYTEVVEHLLNLARRMGGNYQEGLLYLREGLQADRQFEKKIKEIVLGCWFQLGMMMLLTWSFITGALTMVEIKISPWYLGGIFFWQSLGLISLPLLLCYYRNKFFGEIGKLWKMLYVLSALNRVPLARSEIFSLAGIQELKTLKQSSLGLLVEKLKEICHHALREGGNYQAEVKYLMEELRFQEKWHFELFEKRLTVIKLGLLSLFFLPAYLVFLFLLLGDLLTMM